MLVNNIFSSSRVIADNKINLNKKSILVWGRLENIEGKRENAGYQHFLVFPTMFSKPSHSGSLKVGIVW